MKKIDYSILSGLRPGEMLRLRYDRRRAGERFAFSMEGASPQEGDGGRAMATRLDLQLRQLRRHGLLFEEAGATTTDETTTTPVAAPAGGSRRRSQRKAKLVGATGVGHWSWSSQWPR